MIPPSFLGVKGLNSTYCGVKIQPFVLLVEHPLFERRSFGLLIIQRVEKNRQNRIIVIKKIFKNK